MPEDSCRSRARFFGDLSPAHYQVNPCGSLLLLPLLLACFTHFHWFARAALQHPFVAFFQSFALSSPTLSSGSMLI